MHPREKEIEIFLVNVMKFPEDKVQAFLRNSDINPKAQDFRYLISWSAVRDIYGFNLHDAQEMFVEQGYTGFGRVFAAEMRALQGPHIEF